MPAKWDKKRRAWPDTDDFEGIDIIPHFDKTQKQYYNRKAFQYCSGGSFSYDRETFDEDINILLNALLGDNHSYRYIDHIEIRFRRKGFDYRGNPIVERMPEGVWTGGKFMKEGDDETGLEH